MNAYTQLSEAAAQATRVAMTINTELILRDADRAAADALVGKGL